MIILLAFVALAHGRELTLSVNHTRDTQYSMDELLDKLVDKLAIRIPHTSHLKIPHMSLRPARTPPSSLSSYLLQFRRAETLLPTSLLPQQLPAYMRGHHMKVAAMADADPTNSSKAAAVDLDAPMIDDGGLAAEFAKRLEQEGGSTGLNLKIGVSNAKDAVTLKSRQAQRAVSEKVVNPVDQAVAPAKQGFGKWWASLDQNQQTIAKVVGGVIVAKTLVDAIAGAINPPENRPIRRAQSYEEFAAERFPNQNQNNNAFPQDFEEYRRKNSQFDQNSGSFSR